MNNIKKETVTIEYPAKTIEKVVFVTSDNRNFDSFFGAECHEKYLNALRITQDLIKNGEWHFVRSALELELIWLAMSGGKLSKNGKGYSINFPVWMKIEVHQDRDGYWVTEFDELSRNDLETMLKAFSKE